MVVTADYGMWDGSGIFGVLTKIGFKVSDAGLGFGIPSRIQLYKVPASYTALGTRNASQNEVG